MAVAAGRAMRQVRKVRTVRIRRDHGGFRRFRGMPEGYDSDTILGRQRVEQAGGLGRDLFAAKVFRATRAARNLETMT
jgi:hypothetical protein